LKSRQATFSDCINVDTEMSISLFKVSLNELCGIFSKKASLEHILRESYTSFNNACVLYFKNERLNKRLFFCVWIL